MRYITTFALVLSLGCGASSPGPTGGDAAVDAVADGGDGAAMVPDGATTCPEAMTSVLCGYAGDHALGPGGTGGDLHSSWLLIAMRLGADDAVTMCPLPPPCWTCPNRTRMWTVSTLESITRDFIARGNRCP